MILEFSKYQGAGNDFVLINGKAIPELNSSTIKQLCDRHLGIGADGLIVIKNSPTADYEMVYYNADGNIGSMCGNGARCAAKFALAQHIIQANIVSFKAYDGQHTAKIFPDGVVKVSMTEVGKWERRGDDLILNTGSPHYVKYVSNLFEMDVKEEGKKIRYSSEFKAEGINVNFIQEKNGVIHMRTYERGVEDETLACGTGTVAVAICSLLKNSNPPDGKHEIAIKALGGDLKVLAEFGNNIFKNIYLIGPAEKVFDGDWEIT
ncbi:MAG: diaminopimelate epimerase [Bacteroidota bacterium]